MAVKDKGAVAFEQDAIAMLSLDHKRVKKLFAEFQSSGKEATDRQKSAIVAQICQELIVHTTLEEEIFYPAVREAIDDADQMDEALVEHAGAKDLISQLQAAQPEDELYDAKVTVLGEQIDHHVTEEEGSMFPKARGSGVDTIRLSAQMLLRKSELLADGAAQMPAKTPAKLPSKAPPEQAAPISPRSTAPVRRAKKKTVTARKKKKR